MDIKCLHNRVEHVLIVLLAQFVVIVHNKIN